MKMTMKIGVLLGATFLASVGGAAAAECPLPEHGVVQLEWSVVRAGVHEALVEVIGPREAEPGAWNDAVYAEDGVLVWAGVLRCEGDIVVLAADYEPSTGHTRRFEPAVPWWGGAAEPWSGAGEVAAAGDGGEVAAAYEAAMLGAVDADGRAWAATQVERIGESGAIELLWAHDTWLDGAGGLPEARRLERAGQVAERWVRVGVSRPEGGAVVALPALERGETALAEAR
jgi:hypothetical protein